MSTLELIIIGILLFIIMIIVFGLINWQINEFILKIVNKKEEEILKRINKID